MARETVATYLERAESLSAASTMPVTLHHAFLEGQRVSQLAHRGAQQLQRKLVWFDSGWREDVLDVFAPPMD